MGVKTGRYRQIDFQLARCPQCQFAFVVNPWVEFERIYSEEYYQGRGADPTVDYIFELEHPDATVRYFEWRGIAQVIGSLTAIAAGTTWLDYGCGNGGLVRFLRKHHRRAGRGLRGRVNR
jgi:hypothetical protein